MSYDLGDYKIQCDVCLRITKRSKCKPTWDGFIACRDRCWYPKHRADKPIVIPPEDIAVLNPRPRNVKYLTMPGGEHRWDDTTLRWDDPEWRWDDDKSLVPLFHDGNP